MGSLPHSGLSSHIYGRKKFRRPPRFGRLLKSIRNSDQRWFGPGQPEEGNSNRKSVNRTHGNIHDRIASECCGRGASPVGKEASVHEVDDGRRSVMRCYECIQSVRFHPFVNASLSRKTPFLCKQLLITRRRPRPLGRSLSSDEETAAL